MMGFGSRHEDDILAESKRRIVHRSDRLVMWSFAAMLLLDALWVYMISENIIDARTFQTKVVVVNVCTKLIAIGAYFIISSTGRTWYKYVATACAMLCTFLTSAYLSYNLMIMMVIPPLIAMMYNDRRLLTVTAVSGAALMLVALYLYNRNYSLIIGMWYGCTQWDVLVMLILNFYVFYVTVYATIIIMAAVSVIKGTADMRDTVSLKAEYAMKEKELEIASSIQKGMLPSTLPSNGNIRINASMTPAKEVGGDFYDCFEQDDGKVVVIIADVSGKGTPAALFMASAVSILHSKLYSEDDPEKAVRDANNELFRNNSMKYFITMWVGRLDPRTGILEYIDAGHNPPYVVHDGTASPIICRPDFVFGRRKDVGFHKHEMRLEAGSRLFLYTDGITEAHSKDRMMFGESGLKTVLERTSSEDTETVIRTVGTEVAGFTDGPQEDDMTMIAIDYLGPRKDGKITVSADREGYAEVMKLLDETIASEGIDPSKSRELKTICSELFANIDMYSHPDGRKVTVVFDIRSSGRNVELTFSDDGIEFDPLEYNGSTTVGADGKRKKGGLGIMVVRKLSDGITYERTDGMNILKITKEV